MKDEETIRKNMEKFYEEMAEDIKEFWVIDESLCDELFTNNPGEKDGKEENTKK